MLTVTASLSAEVGISGYSVKSTSVSVSRFVTSDSVLYDVDSVMDEVFYRFTIITSAVPPGIERVGFSVFYGSRISIR